MSNGFICLMGIGTVFFGLICIILLCMLMSAACRKFSKPEEKKQEIAAPKTVQNAAIENKQEIIAGVCAVIAEELGTDVKNIKVTSFKRV